MDEYQCIKNTSHGKKLSHINILFWIFVCPAVCFSSYGRSGMQLLAKKIIHYRMVREYNNYQPVDGWKGLAGAVVIQALEDLRSADALSRLSAWTFLTGDAPAWLEVLGLDVSSENISKLCQMTQRSKTMSDEILELGEDDEFLQSLATDLSEETWAKLSAARAAVMAVQERNNSPGDEPKVTNFRGVSDVLERAAAKGDERSRKEISGVMKRRLAEIQDE